VFYALEVVYAARERLGRLPTEEDLVPLQEAKVVCAARERLGRLPTEEDLVPLQEAKEGLTTEKGAKAGVFDDDLIQMVAAQCSGGAEGPPGTQPTGRSERNLTTGKGARAGFIDDDLVRMVAAQTECELSAAECELSAVCSIVGGLVSDQAIKAVSLREKPLRNYMVYDGRDGSGCVYFLSHDFTQ
ncbi:hypothetical protein T484DRAFT_1804239, partial [Baffinella frigidus]